MTLAIESSTNVALDDFRHAKAIVKASHFDASSQFDRSRISVKGERKWPFLAGKSMVGWVCDDVHRQEANYLQVVDVDYLDD